MMRLLFGLVAAMFLASASISDGRAQTSDALTSARDALPAPTHPTEQELVTFAVGGQILHGTLMLPADVERPPVVVMLHDFMGNQYETPIFPTFYGIFDLTAEILAERGFASFRFDFRGSGLSAVNWDGATLASEIVDAVGAINWLANNPRVDGGSVAIIGYGQGGIAAAATAAMLGEQVGSLVLWAPIAHPLATYQTLLGADVIAAGLSSGGAPIVVMLASGLEISLSTGFFEDIHMISPLADIARYDGPMLVIVGTEDTVVTPQPLSGQAFVANHNGPEELLLLETDHDLSASESPEMTEAVALWSLAWIAMTM